MRRIQEEYRRYPRIPCALRVAAQRPTAEFPEDTTDISMGGFSVETTHPLPRGTRSVFSIALPHERHPLLLLGEVVWSRTDGGRPGMGIRITEEEGPEREKLETYVHRLMKDAERI